MNDTPTHERFEWLRQDMLDRVTTMLTYVTLTPEEEADIRALHDLIMHDLPQAVHAVEQAARTAALKDALNVLTEIKEERPHRPRRMRKAIAFIERDGDTATDHDAGVW